VEFYYKEDRLDDPFINDDHVFYLGLATKEELDLIKKLALQVNAALLEIFASIQIQLIDFKIEIGKTKKGELLLADEISPDTCRLWDMGTNEHLDKDVYRRDLGDIVPVYEEVLNRLEKENSTCI
jgi:phosphoribosylaminoimidazole-succinocarboxamide synthase